MRKGFKGFMNKVFKVVWSKSKECYVVVPEIAKNNSGKKKVLASVLAGLAVAGAMGGIAPQQAMADADYGNSHVNVWANTAPDGSNGKNDAGQNSIVVGYQNTTDHTAGNDGKVAIGAKNSATGNSAMAMGNRNVANGGAATAIGAGNESTAATTLTVGNKNNANAENAIAIGAYNNQNWTHGSWQTTPKPAGAYSLAIGNFNDALGSRATAVGAFNTAKGEWATAVGASTVASGDGDVAIGDTSKTNATGVGHAVAVGWHAETGAANAVAVGPSALASGKNSVSVGANNKSRVQDTVTMGQDNDAKTMGGIAIGKNNMVDSTNGGTNFGETRNENSQIAIGRDNTATHLDTIAIGRDTHATGSGATAFGARADASGNNSIAIGQSGRDSKRITASGENAIAIGMRTTSSGASSIAQGAEATATGDYAIAEGRLSKATKQGAIAIGNEAEANIANGVALGASSVTTTDKGVKGYNPSDDHTRHYTNLANNVRTATTAAVSIGNGSTLTRQLTGLASGTADTDAVNVAQLKNVGVALTGNTGSSDFLADGGKLNVRGEGRVSAAVADEGTKDSRLTLTFDDKGMVKAGKNVTVDEKTVNGRTTYTINAADAAAKYDFLTNAKANGGKLDGTATATKVESGQTVNYAAGKNLTVKQDINQSIGEQTYTYSLNSDLGGITSITNNGGPTLHFGDNNISVTGGNLDLGDHNITNLKSGGDVENNAANIGDVTRISKANDLHIAPTAGTNNNVAEYTVDGNKKVTLTYQDGNGKTVNGPKAVIDLSGLPTGDMSSFNVKSTATEGTVARGSQGQQAIRDGKTVEMQAGKNMTIKQTNNNGNAAVEFSLNKNVDLTPDGSLKIGDTNITDNGLTINNGPSITKTGINAGDLNITNVKAGVNDNDAVNVSQLKKVRADERHIKPGEYAVDANGKVTMTYLDGNNNDVANEKAVITGIAKQDLSNINKGGETVIQNLAKKSIDMENGKNTTASHRDVNGVKTFKVDVEGDLTDITSITNQDGDGKVVFGGNQTVNVAGDHNINLNAKVGDITGLTNVTLDAPDFAKKGRAATEEQLKIVNNGFNNTVGLTGNTGATDLQKLNQAGGLSFGVIGANNGQYIKTTASGSNVAVDLSDDAKSKLNNTVEVRGKNAAKVTSVTENTVDGGKKTIYTVDVDNVTPTAASTEKVKAKANVTGSTDTNIAKVTPQTGDQYGDAGATYEVNVSRNDVKDAAREAVTVNTTNTTNNPITVTPVQDETNHNTTYTVTFDGNKAAKQIPLTYKANGQNAQTVTLDKGLNFVNGKNTTASVDGEGVVKYDVNKDLVNINSISNTTNGPKMEFGPNSINITNGPINMGDQNITNLKSGGDVVNNAANIGDVTRISKANDLHIAPTSSNRQGETTTSYAYDAASKSVTLKYNDGNGANQSGTVAKIDLSGLADQIKDGYSFSTDAKGNVVGNHAVTPVANGKTVSYAAGKNLTVAQNIDNATGEHTYTYALSNDVDLTPNGSLKIGDTILNNGGLTITGGPSVTKTGINAGNLNITNVKAGVNETDAVNVKQLKDARTVITSNDNSVTVNKTENGNQVTYDLHVAPGAAQSVWNVKSTGNTTADSETAAKTISDGKTVEMAAGKNLTVKQTSNNDGAKVEFDLANDIKIGNDGKDGKDGVDGKIGVNGKDGSSVVINGKDGSIGLNGKDGKDGLTMKGEKGQPGLNGKDGITRIVYEDNNHDKHEVATLDDGLNFTGNNTDTVNKQKLNSLVKVQGEGVDKNTSATFKSAAGNINVKADGTDTLEVQLNKDLKNINTIKNGGNATFTIGGDNFAFNGGNVSLGGNNITNLKSGIVNNNSTDDTNGANIGDVKTISKANDIHVKDTRYTVNADKTVTLEYVDGNDKKINKTAVIDLSNLPTGGNAITYKANNQNAQTVSLDKGLNFMDGNYTKASVDADGIVKYDVTIGKVKDGVDGKPGVDGNDGIATVKTVVDTINNSGWKGDVTGNTVGNHTATIVKPGTTVNFGAGKNVTVEQIVNAVTGDHTYNYALSDDIKLGKDGKDGVDGRIGVNGKDGSSVVINGKDGSIGLNGKDGKDGLTMKAENGQPGLNGKDGITRIVYEDKNNNKHEVATLDDGLRFTGNNEVENKQKLGSLVKIKGEGVSKDEEATFESAKGNIAVTADGTDTLTVRLNKNIKGIDSIQTKEIHLGTPDNYTTIKKDGDRIKYGDKTIANTDELWTIQANGTDVPANGGKVNVKGADGITVSRTANGEMTISGSGLGTMNSFNVKSTGNTAAGSETAAKKITDGKTVEFSGGNNVTVKQTSSDDGAKVEFALKNNIDLTQDGSVKIGDTKITNGGLVINNGPSITKDGINAGNKQITNVEDGVNDTDAVNVRQLKDAKTKLVDGQNTTVTGDGSKANPYKVNVEGDLNKITSITNKEGDGKLEFKGDQVVNVAGDNTIKLDGKTGDITGLTNKTLDSADFATKGRAATEEQLKLVQQEAAKKSTEKVQAKADANNIAKVAPKAGDTFGAAGATYEVSVDKNDVKDVAREAVTVSGDKKAITVDVQPNATNHTTNYQVNFNGKEAAKQIPLTYKENGSNARTVMLSDGLDFTNGVNTTAHTAANGKVSFDVKGDLTNITSISNNSNGPKMSFGGDSINITGGSLNMGDNYIHNVKAGEKNTDAVNVSQLKAAKTEVEAGRNVTVEHRLGENGQDIYKVNAEAGVDPRVDKLGEEIGHVGAQSAALSALKPIQYDPMEPTQIMAGYGNYRGNSALALGVAHYKNESTMFHAGVSWAGGNGHMMANAGVTWKVGNRDSEAAVADRYRKGPISSTYAMQTEVASMKAQNAGLKGEVSDLKAENEQIKAQNAGLQSEVDQLKAQMAAMMAKLGM